MRKSLSRKYANRKSTLRNLATSFVLYERIKTTQAKGKQLKPLAEHLINQARKGDLTARRRLLSFLFNENAVNKIMEDILPRLKDKKTGFIKTYNLSPRLGDGAKMMILELEKPARNASQSDAGGGTKIEKIEVKENAKEINTTEKSKTDKTGNKAKARVSAKTVKTK